MTRSSTRFCLVLLLILLTGIVFFPGTLVSHAASPRSGYTLVNSEQFTAYGQFLVNETLVASANTSQPLSSVTFGFPGNYSGNMYAISAGYYIGSSHYSSTVSSKISNNTLVTLSLSPQIPAATSANVSLGFYVLNTYKPLTTSPTSSTYLVPMLFYPSVSVPVDNVSSKVQFPYQTTAPLSNPFAFTSFVGGSPLIEDWTYSSNNVTALQPRWEEVQLNSTSADSGYLDFQNIQRTLSVDASGNIIMQDTITVKNLGLNTLTNLQFSFLTNSTTIAIEPSSEPPLSNVQTMTLSSGEMDLSGINRQVEPNDAVTVIMQYNLGSQYWNYSAGVYHVRIPGTAPVNALVDSFSIGYNVPSDYVVLNSPVSLSLTNTTGYSQNSLLTFRRGIGSAFGFALPVGGLVFIAVFLGVLVMRPRKEGDEDVESTIDSMVKAVEEKVSGTNDILSELKSKGEGISRSDLLATRSRIEELRSKTAGRFASLRSQLGQTSVEVQATMNSVASNDRELDRAVKDLLNNYEQFVSKRMKADTLAKVQQNNERRIQHLANTLFDTLHDLNREYAQ